MSAGFCNLPIATNYIRLVKCTSDAAAIVSLVRCKIRSFRVTGAERTVAKNCPGEGSSMVIALSRYYATICNRSNSFLSKPSFINYAIVAKNERRAKNYHREISITMILIYYASFGLFTFSVRSDAQNTLRCTKRDWLSKIGPPICSIERRKFQG